MLLCGDASAQRKTKKKPAPPPAAPTELSKLRDEYVRLTNEYKASLEKLLPFYENELRRSSSSRRNCSQKV
jgi:hypothetical protein